MNIKTLTLTAVVALGTSAAFAEEVRVYNWSDYIDEELLNKFEEENGPDPDLRRVRQQRGSGNQNVGGLLGL